MLLGGPSYQETWSSSSSNLDPYWRLYSTADHKGSPPALLLSRPLHRFKVSQSNSTVFSNNSFGCLRQKHDKWYIFLFRTLSITNKTNALWTLKPVIDAEYWSGPLTFTVEPQTMNKGYPISYHPLTMTQEGKKHTVSDWSWGIHSLGNWQCHFVFLLHFSILVMQYVYIPQ